MSERILVNVSNLLLDIENFRLGSLGDQKEVIKKMTEDQRKKLINLATHIAENGLNPLENIAVFPDESDLGYYWVIEGNRRVLAIKILSDPEILDGTILEAQKQKINKAVERFESKPIEEVECVAFENHEDATLWMRLRHTGENDGRGIVNWSATAKSQLESAAGGSKINASALTILGFLKKNGVEITKDYPITNLTRLLGTPAVRQSLRLVDVDPLKSNCPPESLLKIMLRIYQDLNQPGAVNSIRYLQDRLDYIENLQIPSFELVPEWIVEDADPVIQTSQPHPTHPTPLPGQQGSTATYESPNTPESPLFLLSDKERTSPQSRSLPLSQNRKRLIPSSYTIKITSPRINAIFKELKSLDNSIYPNACAVLFRVFLELSLDNFLNSKKLVAKDKLADKIHTIATHMKEQKIMTKEELDPINRMFSDPNCFFSTASLNAYVHNPRAIPLSHKILNNIWDSIDHFVKKLWE